MFRSIALAIVLSVASAGANATLVRVTYGGQLELASSNPNLPPPADLYNLDGAMAEWVFVYDPDAGPRLTTTPPRGVPQQEPGFLYSDCGGYVLHYCNYDTTASVSFRDRPNGALNSAVSLPDAYLEASASTSSAWNLRPSGISTGEFSGLYLSTAGFNSSSTNVPMPFGMSDYYSAYWSEPYINNTSLPYNEGYYRVLQPYLIATEVVPIPAAVWLFGSALGVMGWMRRKAIA
jgi:hypothetical protein